MKPKQLNIIIGGILLLSTISCKNNDKTEAASDITFHGDTITISETSPILSKLKFCTLTEEPFSEEFKTVGTVEAEPGRYAEVCPPFDGRIICSMVRLGDKVKAGQCLFEMSSSEFVEACKAYFQAVSNHEKAKAEYQRKKSLCNHGIISQRDLEEALTETQNAQSEMESAASTLRVFGTDLSSLKMGQSLRVCAPISGEVVANHITVGQYIKSDDGSQVTIADLGVVWVTALVKERYIGTVKSGGQAEVFTESEPDSITWGKIIHVGNMVDEETRSVQVVIACNNSNRKLKHGMYVSVHFIDKPHPAIVLPSSAIFQGEHENYVYVATDRKNTYVRRQVEVSTAGDDIRKICVHNGLRVGESVMTEGGIYLND